MPEKTDYLKFYDEAPDEKKYPLVQGWIKTEPLPFFAQLRAERPVLVTPECTLVANFTDVRDGLQMPKVLTVDLYKPKQGVDESKGEVGYLMAHDDDALHYREKSLMQGFLNRDDLPLVRAMVAKTAERVLREANGNIELVTEYCRIVPVHLVQEYFGLDGIDQDNLIHWSYWNQYDAFNNQPFDMLSDDEYKRIVELHEAASKELGVYIATLIARKWVWFRLKRLAYLLIKPPQKLLFRILGMAMKERPDTMIERMLLTKFSKKVGFSITRLGVNAGGLLIGAIETTSQAVAQVVQYFIDHPELLKKAKDKARQNVTPAFDLMVWEALRFVPIRPDIFRIAGADYTIAKGTKHETEIKKGTIVRLLTHSAMFDPSAYEKPDEFNPDRTFYHNFTFGYGAHQCLGKYVGMEMIPEMVRQILLLEGLESKGSISYRNTEFPDRDGPFPEEYHLQWFSGEEPVYSPKCN